MTKRTLPALVPDHSYTIETHCGCKVVRGSVPLRELAALTETWADLGEDGQPDQEWVIDYGLASLLEVTVVAGTRFDLNLLRGKAGFD